MEIDGYLNVPLPNCNKLLIAHKCFSISMQPSVPIKYHELVPRKWEKKYEKDMFKF